MLNLLLISSCAAFLYALAEEALAVFLTIKHKILMRAILTMLFSYAGVWLAGIPTLKLIALYILSNAFLATVYRILLSSIPSPLLPRPSRTRDVRLPL